MVATERSSVESLEKEILNIGEMVELAISRSISCLIKRDVILARAVIKEDELIDRAEVAVQESCVAILENERPVGRELRFVVATLKINDSLERIGDLAENVAAVVVEVGNWERFLHVGGIEDMATVAQKMVHESLRSFVTRDIELARKVIDDDDTVDAAHRRIRERIEFELDRIPENASPLLALETVTRQFERIGDIACKIAEEVIYLVEGEIVRHR
ncbi:MAG: phosphate signaling complex protein PhoU [Planctomycetales bacterium]|nr:phosphate signaling complex protein PhoU [Planctomycetales bacterium]